MIKITKEVKHRHITEEEFRKQKNSSPYKQLRTAAKGVNFLCLFGGSAKVLSEQALETSWTVEQIDEYLKDNDLSTELENVKKIYKNEDETKQKYIAVSTRIRDNFFKGYPGLMNRILREQKYARDHGFCRTYFGMTRNFIELMLQGEYDQKTISGVLRNESNIAANVRCQNSEAAITKRVMAEMQDWIFKNNYKSLLWNEIHDSQDMYLYKPEIGNILPHWKHLCERKIPEMAANWIPLLVDIEIADLSDPNHDDCYKGGRAPIEFGIQDWDNCQYLDEDPFGVELYEEAEREYFSKRAEYWKSLKKRDPLALKIKEYLEKKYS